MSVPGRAAGSRRTAEALLVLGVVAGFVNVLHRFAVEGVLPQPFIFDFSDTFMDWFNTAYYAHNRGAYEVWSTVYPPLSFVFLRLFGFASCYTRDSHYARDCDTFGVAAILFFYVVAVGVAGLAFRRADRSTAAMRGLAFGLSMPMLFVLERGNLIIPCLTCFIVAHGDLSRRKWVRALTAGLTINFKPYLLLPVMAWLIRRDWRVLELSAVASIGIYCLAYAILGTGSPLELLHDTVLWLQFTGGQVWEQVFYSTSYAPFLEFNSPRFPTRDFIPSTLFEPFIAAIPVVIRVSQMVAVACLVGAWLQPRALAAARISLLLLSASLIGQSPGGYTLAFVIFLLLLEKWERPGPIVALIAGYALAVPFDYSLGNFFTLSGDSWLAGRPVAASYGVSVGMFLRPGLLVIMFLALAADSLWLIVRAHRAQRPLLGARLPWHRGVVAT